MTKKVSALKARTNLGRLLSAGSLRKSTTKATST